MKIRILGCGGSFGSPLAYGQNGNIDTNNSRNFRTRSSVLINVDKTNLLIDTSPDLRQQLYSAKITNIDAVLYTHYHTDHVSGIPDMRAISFINKISELDGYVIVGIGNIVGWGEKFIKQLREYKDA